MLRIANTVNEDGELEFVSEENLIAAFYGSHFTCLVNS